MSSTKSTTPVKKVASKRASTRRFPETVRCGSAAVKIYHSPLRPEKRSKSNEAPDGDGERQEYESYVVSYYEGTKRVRNRYGDYDDAKSHAETAVVKLANGDLAALKLSGDDRRIYVAVLEQVRQCGISLDLAVKEYVEASRILGKTSVLEAARFYEKYGTGHVHSATVPQIVPKFLADLSADGASPYHQRDLAQRIQRFADLFPGEISEIKSGAIDTWLRDLGLAPKTRNHYRDAIVNLFHFAQRNQFLPKNVPTAADDTKRVDPEGGEILILSVEELKKLLTNAPVHLVPALVIKAFVGVRTEELLRMDWSHVSFAKRSVILPREVTKTKKRRIIPMQDNLLAWLTPYKGKTGRICERWARPQAIYQAIERLAAKFDIHAGANKFRHSYVSYRTAQTSDLQKVSLECGNSPAVIQEDYLELVTPIEADEWFSIFPLKDLQTPQVEISARSA